MKFRLRSDRAMGLFIQKFNAVLSIRVIYFSVNRLKCYNESYLARSRYIRLTYNITIKIREAEVFRVIYNAVNNNCR